MIDETSTVCDSESKLKIQKVAIEFYMALTKTLNDFIDLNKNTLEYYELYSILQTSSLYFIYRIMQTLCKCIDKKDVKLVLNNFEKQFNIHLKKISDEINKD